MDDEQEWNVELVRERLTLLLGEHAPLYPRALEDQFPRILVRLVEVWGKPAGDDYLMELTVTQRPNRQGFPEAVAVELFRLAQLHDSFGFRPKGVATAWDWANDAELLNYRGNRGL